MADNGSNKPLVPRAIIGAMALILMIILFFVIIRDSDPAYEYDGGRTIIVLIALIGAILGFPLGANHIKKLNGNGKRKA